MSVVLGVSGVGTIALAGPAHASATANFVGTWIVSNGEDFTITSQSGGSCAGVSALEPSGYDLIDCTVSGSAYSFTITYGSDYESYNTGTISGNSLTGEFHDTNGTTEGYTATREGEGTLTGTVWDQQCSDTSCKRVGLGGVDIEVTGTDDAGNAVDETSTSASSGTWTLKLATGTYTATPEPDGFDPTSVPDIALGSGKTVDNLDFATCAGTADPGVTPLSSAAGASSGNGCVNGYTVTLSANIPQAQFVDPSGNGAGANRPDGRDYPSHNYTGPGHSTLFASFDGTSYYPGCPNQFNLTRREQLTKAGDEVQWRDYFIRSSGLGSITLHTAWNRHTREAVVLGLDSTPGTMTRVYDYEITSGGQTRTGTCKDPETVVPYAIYKPNGNEFSLIVTWAFPFTVNGGSKPGDVLPEPPAAVKTAVKRTLAKVPGFSSLTPGKQQVVYLGAIELVKIFHKNVSWAGAIQKLSDEVDSLVTFGAGELLKGPLALVDGVEKLISVATDGYPTMDAKIVGQFKNFRYKNAVHADSTGTQLVLNAATDLFPNYVLTVTRNTTGVLPWSASSSVVKVDNTFAQPTTDYPLGLPDGWLDSSDSGATASANLLGGFTAKGVLRSDMAVVKNVFTWVGTVSTSFNAPLSPGKPNTITWQTVDGKP